MDDDPHAELTATYREIYDAVPPAHTVPAVMPYWQHIYRQLTDLNEVARLRQAGDAAGAQQLLEQVVDAHAAGVGGEEWWELERAHADGELMHAVGDPARVDATMDLIRANLRGERAIDSPGL